IAGALVRADLRGVDTHGMVRLPGYIDRLRKGLVNPRPELKFSYPTPVAAQLDGDNGFGFAIAYRAMSEALSLARQYGLGLVSVKRSTHFGMAANYLLQAVEAGFAAFVFTNASRAMPPWGGREALLGTSPFAVGVPGGGTGDFILDMSPSVAARGKIRRALRHGQPIPLGFALDESGQPTTDPAEALKGVVLPIGGAKGSGLSMMMDILCGVMSGAAFSGEVGDQYKNYDRPQNVGHFFLALKPDLFVSAEELRVRMDHLLTTVRSVPKAEGFSEILIPGEPERRLEAERVSKGIPYSLNDLQPLLDDAKDAGIDPPLMAPVSE
ncbi:MAG: Ldh family oxidoreductase, partial [Rhodospirillales bacterium]|nr:Ldh family oxidoreductase [Rhodospirillales bacterium]